MSKSFGVKLEEEAAKRSDLPVIVWRTQYDYARDAVEREASAIRCMDDSLAQQHYKDEVDLNVILARLGVTYVPPAPPDDPRYYGDVSDVPDLRTLLEIRREAEWSFMQLDPKLRLRFGNDPANLWQFVTDPDNADECVRLGLLKREEPAVVPPAPQATSVPSS